MGGCLLALLGRRFLGAASYFLYSCRRAALDRQPDLVGAQRQYELGIGDRLVANFDCVSRRVDRGNARVGAHHAVQLRGHLLRRIEWDALRRLAAAVRARQHGLRIEMAAVGADDGERRFLVELAQFARDVVAGKPAAEDDDGVHVMMDS